MTSCLDLQYIQVIIMVLYLHSFVQESKPLLCGIASIDGSLEASRIFMGWC